MNLYPPSIRYSVDRRGIVLVSTDLCEGGSRDVFSAAAHHPWTLRDFLSSKILALRDSGGS